MDKNTNTQPADDVTKDEALVVIGQVWAGNAGDEVWRPFNAGDYAKARDIAARKVAEQDGETPGSTAGSSR